MRVPTNANSATMLDRIALLNARQSKIQNQVATGQRIFQPEDDPAAVGRLLTLDNEKRQLLQYSKNASFATDVSTATFSALSSIKKISDRAGEIATLGTTTQSDAAFDAYAAEVDQLLEQTLQLGNTKLRTDYLFSGTALATAPFTATRATPEAPLSAVTYGGETVAGNVVRIPIGQGATIEPGASIATNQEIQSFMTHLVSLRDALQTRDLAGIQTQRTNLEGSEDALVDAMAAHGAVGMRIEIAQTQITERLDNIDSLVSDETDVDLPETITKLNQASLAYQAALQSASQIMRLSLLDYLK